MTVQSPFSSPAHDAALARIEAVVATGPYQADRESLRTYRFPDWHLDGKFGIFIHWGPSLVPGFRADWHACARWPTDRGC